MFCAIMTHSKYWLKCYFVNVFQSVSFSFFETLYAIHCVSTRRVHVETTGVIQSCVATTMTVLVSYYEDRCFLYCFVQFLAIRKKKDALGIKYTIINIQLQRVV